MKTYLTLFIVACQSLTALAQDGKPYITKSLASDAIDHVTVNTSAGGIKVSGAQGESPRIEVYIKGNNGRELSKEEIEKRLNEYDMSISVDGHELKAMVKQKHTFNWKQSLNISFKIFVPEKVSTILHSSGGGIDLDNLSGNENFTTSGGGLTIDRLNGVVRGHTSGGGIDVSNSGNDLDLSTSGGGITAKRCNGSIKLVTSGGGLRLENLKGTIYARTSGGGIDGHGIEGELTTSTSGGGIDLKQMNCSLEAHSSGGGIDVEMLGVGKYLKLSSSAGDVDVRLPNKGYNIDMHAQGFSQRLNNFSGDWSSHHVSGTVNGGGVPVQVTANSGTASLKFN